MRGTEGTLDRGRGDRVGGRIGKRFQHGLGAAGIFRKQQRQGADEGIEAEVGLAGVAFDAIEESGEIDELAAGVHEMEVEQFALGGHAGSVDRIGGLAQ